MNFEGKRVNWGHWKLFQSDAIAKINVPSVGWLMENMSNPIWGHFDAGMDVAYKWPLISHLDFILAVRLNISKAYHC